MMDAAYFSKPSLLSVATARYQNTEGLQSVGTQTSLSARSLWNGRSTGQPDDWC